jgi:hypothetical protein
MCAAQSPGGTVPFMLMTGSGGISDPGAEQVIELPGLHPGSKGSPLISRAVQQACLVPENDEVALA